MQGYTDTAGQAYAFLSQPPPPPPSNPTKMAENMRRRSTTISAWASTVQPGPPAPISPSRLEFAPDVRTTRRKSHSAAPTSSFPAPPSPVAYIPAQDSPTSSSHSITPALKQDAKHDLPSVGYTSIFVTLPPKTPPAEYTPDRRRSLSAAPRAAASPTPTAAAGKGFLRGLSLKHARSKSTAAPDAADAPAPAAKSKPAKERKAKYADARPPQISTDLALAQFMGGGKIEHHMKQHAKAQAKAAGAVRVDGQLVGVGALHRDARGGVWRDAEEELEYAGLLDGAGDAEAGDAEWVRFDARRGGGDAVRPSMDSLDPRYAMYAEVDPLDASGRYARRSADYPSSSSSSFGGAGRSRRRPEPLALVPEHALHAADARQEFLESSFAPPARPAVPGPHASGAAADASGTKKSMLKGLFKSKKPARA